MGKTGVGADKTTVQNLGFCASGVGAITSYIDVKDGKVLRIRPLRYDDEYTRDELRPWEYVVGDKKFEVPMKAPIPPFVFASKHRTYSKNRVPFPLKRVDWDPQGERNPQNRGKSKFQRISWDEATDIIAAEIRRQYDTYGPYSILMQQDGHGETKIVHAPHGCMDRLLQLMGGAVTQARNADSWEGWYWGARYVWGQEPLGQAMNGNAFWDISKNSKMLLYWGCDAETTTWGWTGQLPSKLMFWFSDLGIKSVFVCPDLNYAAAVHADRWIPIKPNTDLALQFAIAYVWLTEDTYDKEFVEKATIGFDWLEYEVMGIGDGIPKTPQWASAICGVPSRIIKALAREWYENATSIAHCNGGSYIRGPYSHEPARMEAALLAMQGLGAPGRHQVKFIEWSMFGLDSQVPVPRSEVIPMAHGAYNGVLQKVGEPHFIPKTLIPQAIMTEDAYEWYGHTVIYAPTEDQFVKFRFPAKDGDPHIHMIWTDTPCWSTCWNGGNEFIKALRSDRLDFVLAQHPWLENDCLYADIVLPVSTRLELEDFGTDYCSGCFNTVYYEGQCIEHVGESKSDWEAVCAIAEKLGLLEEYTKGRDVEQCIRDGLEQSGVGDRITFEELKEKGFYAIPTAEGWQDDAPGFSKFYNDPENNPISTPSGKLEIYSPRLGKFFPDDDERRPYPHYLDHGITHNENLGGTRSEDYPFLLVSNHPRWRLHANMDDIAWFREIPTSKVKGPDGYLYEPVWINPVDAQRLGIEDGDVVKLFNERGWVLGGAYVTERITTQTVYQDHGSRLDSIEPGISDRGGANNLIAPSATSSKNAAGEVTSGYLVGIEKVDVQELAACYPEVFARAYDPMMGVLIDNWIVDGSDR